MYACAGTISAGLRPFSARAKKEAGECQVHPVSKEGTQPHTQHASFAAISSTRVFRMLYTNDTIILLHTNKMLHTIPRCCMALHPACRHRKFQEFENHRGANVTCVHMIPLHLEVILDVLIVGSYSGATISCRFNVHARSSVGNNTVQHRALHLGQTTIFACTSLERHRGPDCWCCLWSLCVTSRSKPPRLVLAIQILVAAAKPTTLGVAVEPCLALIDPPAALRGGKDTQWQVSLVPGRKRQGVLQHNGTCCLQLAGVHEGSGAAVNPKHLFPVRSLVYLCQKKRWIELPRQRLKTSFHVFLDFFFILRENGCETGDEKAKRGVRPQQGGSSVKRRLRQGEWAELVCANSLSGSQSITLADHIAGSTCKHYMHT